MTFPPLATVAFQLGERNLDLCNSGVECHLSEAVTEPVSVVLAVAFSVALLIGFTYLSKAREICDIEHCQIRAEREAFERFDAQLRALDPADEPSPLTDDGGVQSLSTRDVDPELHQIRTAYRETVMDVSHYEQEYGDTLVESIAEEFGPDIAAVMCAGQNFTPQLRDTLSLRTSQARTCRDELLAAVDAELEMIDTSATKLDRISRQRDALVKHIQNDPQIEALTDVWTRLGDIKDRIGTELTGRQEFIRDPPIGVTDEMPSFQEYLYSSLDISYPLLVSGAVLGERIHSDRQEIHHSIAYYGTRVNRSG